MICHLTVRRAAGTSSPHWWEVGRREVEVGRGSYRSVVFLGPLLAAVSSDRNFNLSPVRHRLHPKVSPFSVLSLLHLNRFSVSSTTVLANKHQIITAATFFPSSPMHNCTMPCGKLIPRSVQRRQEDLMHVCCCCSDAISFIKQNMIFEAEEAEKNHTQVQR